MLISKRNIISLFNYELIFIFFNSVNVVQLVALWILECRGQGLSLKFFTSPRLWCMSLATMSLDKKNMFFKWRW